MLEENLHPAELSARYDAGNKQVSKSASEKHFKRLVEAVRGIVSGTAHPFALSDVAGKAIQEGLPVDSHALFADEKVLACEARYLALALGELAPYHRDCRLWLAEKMHKPEERIEASIPWNLALGGQAINPTGE